MPLAAMAPPELWLFDLDGVLVDTTTCHARAYAELWRQVGVSGPPYEAIAGRRTVDVIVEVTGLLAPSAHQLSAWVRRKQELARDCMASQDLSFPDARALIDTLARRGAAIAIGTAASRATTLAIVQRSGWTEVIPTVVTADDVHRGKPAPDVFVEAMRRAGTPPARTLVIEDSRSGLAAAIASGAWVASVRTGNTVHSGRFVGAFATLADLLGAVGPDAA